jgi:hypothetical protein
MACRAQKPEKTYSATRSKQQTSTESALPNSMRDAPLARAIADDAHVVLIFMFPLVKENRLEI